ncbi:MAG TPA: multiheme c-type cytochrome, partial [Kofleriaceae bacterium]|nr:multiheme c-type cytochrome [Kofleriaceae bacterium]
VKSNGGSQHTTQPVTRPTFTVFALAETRGQIGPCGCTTDPLGDISRTAKLVAETRAAGPTLVVDAGSLLYSKAPIPAHLVAQEELKADLLVSTYQKSLEVAAVGVGPADLAAGPGKLRLPRQAANVTGIEVQPPKLVVLGGAKVGTFGVVAPGAITGVEVGDPVAAGKKAVASLREQGAQVIVGLVQASTKKDAAKLVREIGGIDLAIAGLGLEAPEPERIVIEPQQIGDGWLVVPGNRGQIVSRLDVTIRDGGPLVDAIGSGAAEAKIASFDRQLAALDTDLQKFAADKDADPVFIKQKEDERKALLEQKNQLARQPLVVPAKGSYFTLQQVRINKTLACDEPVQSAVTAFYAAAGEANLKAAAKVPVPPPAKGQAGYVGQAACEDCHDEAAKFWKSTRHAGAWETLVDRGQQFDFDCIGCHVTGWNEKGGANLAHNEPLRDVQCETCHGPGSIHVAKGGEEKPLAIALAPPQDLCLSKCHTKDHSDTFQWEAYMRDIVGPGHGADARARLGDGPSGGQLRKAALAKAGRMGPGCIR